MNRTLEFYDSDISYSSFYSLKLHNVNIVNCKAEDVDFRKCDLSGSNLKQSDFNKSAFYDTISFETNFEHSKNYVIDPLTSRVIRTVFSPPEALSLLECLKIRFI